MDPFNLETLTFISRNNSPTDRQYSEACSNPQPQARELPISSFQSHTLNVIGKQGQR